MPSFFADRWFLCPGMLGNCTSTSPDARTIVIADEPGLPGFVRVTFPPEVVGQPNVVGHGFFSSHSNPLSNLIYFREPHSDGTAHHYVGQVTRHDDIDPSNVQTTVRGKRRHIASDGTIVKVGGVDVADDDWTSNRPVA